MRELLMSRWVTVIVIGLLLLSCACETLPGKSSLQQTTIKTTIKRESSQSQRQTTTIKVSDCKKVLLFFRVCETKEQKQSQEVEIIEDHDVEQKTNKPPRNPLIQI